MKHVITLHFKVRPTFEILLLLLLFEIIFAFGSLDEPNCSSLLLNTHKNDVIPNSILKVQWRNCTHTDGCTDRFFLFLLSRKISIWGKFNELDLNFEVIIWGLARPKNSCDGLHSGPGPSWGGEAARIVHEWIARIMWLDLAPQPAHWSTRTTTKNYRWRKSDTLSQSHEWKQGCFALMFLGGEFLG